MTGRGLSDPRSVEADRLAHEAEYLALRGGLPEDVRSLYGRAAAIEEAIAEDAIEEPLRVRSVLALTAATLWYRAAAYEDTLRVVTLWVARELTPDARSELLALGDRAGKAIEHRDGSAE
jgi:hypothetical protein